jgi:predicted amidohydrolase
MKLAAIQLDLRRGDVAANLAAAEGGLRAAAAAGASLAVLPELWPTSFPGPGDDLAAAARDDERALARVAELSRELELAICGSALAALEPDRPEPRAANRWHLFERGRLGASYDKVHLFTPTAEHESTAPGDDPPPTIATRAGRVSGLVCYDLRFPELTRRAFEQGAEIVCVSAQWPAPRAAHYRALALGLAVQNQCFVVACNRVGREAVGRRQLELDFAGGSLIASPHGVALAEAGDAPGITIAEIDLAVLRELRARVPVAKDRRPDVYAAWRECSTLSSGF